MENGSITSIIEDVLKRMTIDYESIEVIDNGINTTYLIKTDDAGILIGNRGETLESLGFIIRRLVESRNKDSDERHMFIVDVNNYQAKKLDEFKQSITLSADRVRLFKESVELSPMTSYERMIVHSMFSDDPDIRTESEGEGKFRRVVLKYGAHMGADREDVSLG